MSGRGVGLGTGGFQSLLRGYGRTLSGENHTFSVKPPYSADEETEAQKGSSVFCLWSWLVAEPLEKSAVLILNCQTPGKTLLLVLVPLLGPNP